MSKSSIKAASLLVALFVLFTFTAGCTKPSNQQQASSAATTQTEATTQTQASTQQATTVEEKPVDLQGREIRIAAWWDETPSADTPTGKLIVERNQAVEKKYNCKFTYLNMSEDDLNNKFVASTLSGDPFAEIVFTKSYKVAPGWASKGYVLALEELYDFSQPFWNKSAKELTTYNEHVYGLSNYRTEVNGVTYFNKAIFEKFGLPNPYELVKNNQWTWDKFEEIAKMANKDTNGDGKIDIYGAGDTGTGDGQLWYVENGANFTKVQDGKYVSAVTDPAFVETLEYFKKLVSVDKLSEIWPEGVDWDYGMKQFGAGKYAMKTGGWFEAWIYKNEIKMADAFGVLPNPIGPRGTGFTCTQNYISCRVMPASVKNPEDVALVYSQICAPLADQDEEAIYRAGIENSVCDKESVDIFLMLSGLPVIMLDYERYPSYYDIISPATKSAVMGEKSSKTAMEEINAKWQADIDKALEQK